MGVGALSNDQLRPDVLKRLTKTTRPFYQKSLALVNTCRNLPQPPQGAREQIKARNALFRGVEDTLVYGTSTPPNKKLAEIDSKFEEQYKAINAYISDYLGPDSEIQPLDWEEVTKKDNVAGSFMKQVKADVVAKLESLKSIPTLKLSVCLWPEEPRKWGDQKWEYKSLIVDFHIDEEATLDILLHRIFEAKSLIKGEWTQKFSLKNNPQFYKKFPNTLTEHFRASNPESSYIPALDAWDRVRNYEVLQLIVDRRSNRKITLEDRSKIDLPHSCSNGWHLDDDKATVVVRLNAGLSSALAIWNTKKEFQVPPLLSPSSSTSTLPGFSTSLNLHELDNLFQPTKGGVQDKTTSNPESSKKQAILPARVGPSLHNTSPFSSESPPSQTPPAQSSSTQRVAPSRAPPPPLVVQTPKAPDAAPNKPKNIAKTSTQFDRYSSQSALSMGMVKSPPPEPQGGFRGWFKKKLQDFVGPQS